MRRLLDLLIVTVLLGAAGIGAYEIGHRVDHLSNQAATNDPELNGTTTVATHTTTGHAHTIAGRHVTPFFVIGAIVVVLLAFLAATLVNTLVKGRKRERWRVSN